MARGPLDFLGGLLDGLSRLPEQLFGGGGFGGLLDGLFGGGKRRPASKSLDITPQVDGTRYNSFPTPGGVAKNTPRPAPSTVKRAKSEMTKTHADWTKKKKNPLMRGCPGGT